MKKSALLTMFVLSVYLSSYAQTDTLKVYGSSPHLYLYHTVQKGDNYYSLGRQFHLRPKAIATANNMTFNDALKLNQLIKIPLNSDNFSQQAKVSSSQYQPVVRQVYAGETLFRIGLNNNKVPLNQLRNWNHLKGNNIRPGEYLVVGWLKKDHRIPPKDGAATIKNNTASSVDNTPENNIVKLASLPIDNKRNKDIINNKNLRQSKDPIGLVAQPAVAKAIYRGSAKSAENDISPAAEKVENSSVNNVIPVANDAPVNADIAAAPSAFEQQFLISSKNNKDITTDHGAATWFRSNLQPGSKKYYALYNAVPRGTIVKVANPINGHAVFVKILSTVPDLKENANTVIKISDAAKEDLGIKDNKFYCQITYPKQDGR